MRFLSFGGRLTLIKSIFSNLPIYYLFIFKMPEGVAKEINKIQCSFLWGDSDSERKLRMVCWEKILLRKKMGGLGVKDLKIMNEALLLKWWWRFCFEKDDGFYRRALWTLHNLIRWKEMILSTCITCATTSSKVNKTTHQGPTCKK